MRNPFESKLHALDLAAQESVHNKLRERRLAFLNEVRSLFDQIVDGLGHHIEDGIKEAVVGLNAFGIRTESSCEGHLDRGEPYPWIAISPLSPNHAPAGYYFPELGERIERQAKVLREQTQHLLNEFYAGRKEQGLATLSVPPPFRIRNGFFLAPRGAEMVRNGEGSIEPEEFLKQTQEEMRLFAEFLIERFLERGEVRDVQELFASYDFPEDATYEQSEHWGESYREMVEELKRFEPSGSLIEDAARLADALRWSEERVEDIRSGKEDARELLTNMYRQTAYVLSEAVRDDKGRPLKNEYWSVVVPVEQDALHRILTHHGIDADALVVEDEEEA